MDFGILSMSHEAVSKLYTLASCIKDDKAISKDEILEEVLEIIDVLDELNHLLH